MRTFSAGEIIGIPDDAQNVPITIAVIGCGGKTTFINSLAYECSYLKVLITPTTKIKPMDDIGVSLCNTMQACERHKPKTGVQCFGIQNSATGKLEALPIELLEKAYRQYELVLLEADGSRGLPCKGWLDSEPVIPDFVTHTVGVVTMNAIGAPADEHSVLRLPEFLRLTHLEHNAPITVGALTSMVCAPDGMFKNARGKAHLFVNQAEDEETEENARAWLCNIQKTYPEKLASLAYGSAQKNTWQRI